MSWTLTPIAQELIVKPLVKKALKLAWDYASSSGPYANSSGSYANSSGSFANSSCSSGSELERERQEEEEREREWQRELKRREEARRERERRHKAELERKRQEQLLAEKRERRAKKARIEAVICAYREEMDLLMKRRVVLLRMRKKLGSLRHFVKRKEVKELGKKLFWRGLRSLATHSVLTVCTKGLGTKLAIAADKENFIRVGRLTLDLNDIKDSWDSARIATDGLSALDVMNGAWHNMEDLDPGNPTDHNVAEWDQIKAKAETYLKSARDQNNLIVDSTKDYHNLLNSLSGEDAALLDPHFGSHGQSVFVVDEVGPNGEKLTGTANGHIIEVDDNEKEILPDELKPKAAELERPKEPEVPPPAPAVTSSSN